MRKSETEKIVRDIICNQIDVSPELVTTEKVIVDDLGADPLDMVEIIMSIEEELDIFITDEEAESIKTVGDAVNFILTKGGKA